jgi:hypothetical protein
MVTYEFNRHFRTTKTQRGVLVTYSNVLRRGKRKKRAHDGEGEAQAARKPKHSRATRGANRAQESPSNEEKASEDGDNDEDQVVQSDTAGDDNEMDDGDDDSEENDEGDDEGNDEGDDGHAE